MKTLITIEDVAVRFNVSKATVNYYSNLGLIIVAQKNKNRRLYDLDDVTQRIEKVREMLNAGYTLRLIQREFLQAEGLKT